MKKRMCQWYTFIPTQPIGTFTHYDITYFPVTLKKSFTDCILKQLFI